jgi:hypothetical protein
MAYVETTSGAQFSVAQAVTTTVNATNIFDVTGAGSGNAPAMIGPNGVNTALGFDIGGGSDGMATPDVLIEVTTAGTGTGTVTFTLAAAPDNGSYSPGTYTTVYTSAAFVGSTLTKGLMFKFQVPSLPPTIKTLPRFYQLTYTVTGTFSASFTSELLLNAPDNILPTLYGNNIIAV